MGSHQPKHNVCISFSFGGFHGYAWLQLDFAYGLMNFIYWMLFQFWSLSCKFLEILLLFIMKSISPSKCLLRSPSLLEPLPHQFLNRKLLIMKRKYYLKVKKAKKLNIIWITYTILHIKLASDCGFHEQN